MSVPLRLAAFALAVVAAFGLGFGVGDVAGPFEDDTPEQQDPHGWHGGMEDGR